MRTDEVIIDDALSILSKNLDPVEVQRFIVTINRKSFDYTKWKDNLKKEGETLESLSQKAQQYFENTHSR